ncbi:MAG TPA: hypothetical protein VI542_19370, partial [Candidatus Tectomicrobia bacterium]
QAVDQQALHRHLYRMFFAVHPQGDGPGHEVLPLLALECLADLLRGKKIDDRTEANVRRWVGALCTTLAPLSRGTPMAGQPRTPAATWQSY